MERHLRMSRKELRRKTVLEGVADQRLALGAASEELGLSYRQTLRVWKRFQAEGDAGLVHRSRGRPSSRGKPAGFRARVLARYRERYAAHELGPTLASEKLEEAGLSVDHETLRRWLLTEGLWCKHRRRRAHRIRRERKSHFGELVQMDGSHHRWLGPEKPARCLMDMVDDATGRTLALLSEEETTEAAMTLLWRWIERHGIPAALYTDKKNVFVTDREPTLEEQVSGEEPLTAFGQACRKLGISIITANSPQAKGRVERKHGVFQDRFVKELRLCGITTISGANKLLNNGFLDNLNAKFAQAPLERQDYHRAVGPGVVLEEVFSLEAVRTVQNDWTVRHENVHYQIAKDNAPLPKPKDKVVVRRLLDGATQLLYRDRPLRFERLTPRQLRGRRERAVPPFKPKPKPSPPARSRAKTWRPNCRRLSAGRRQ